MTTTENKLSVRKDRVFKKPSASLYKARVATVLKKAFELSELCGVDVCIIWYDREGNLVKTWPEKEEAKVRAMAERYRMLSEEERKKKSNNLSGFLNKKMIRDKKESLKANDHIFSHKVLELEDSLESRLHTLQESLHLDQTQETQRCHIDQPQDLSCNDSSLINVYHHQASLLNYPTSSNSESCVDDVSSSMNHGSKFSVLLFNHDDGTFTQLPNSSALPSFEQSPCNQDYGIQVLCSSAAPRFEEPSLQDYGYLNILLGEQGCNNIDLLMPTLLPPPIQTQTPNFQQFMQTQPVYNHQIPYFGRMLS